MRVWECHELQHQHHHTKARQASPSPFAEEAGGLRGPADEELGAARLLGGGLLLPRGAARARREEGGLALVPLPLLEPAARGKSEAVSES